MNTAKVVFLAVAIGLAMTISSCEKDKSKDDIQAAYDAADGVRGARLYDHALNELGITGLAANDHSNYYRCKTCHGWDLLGNEGVAIGQIGSTTKPEPAPVNLMEVRANDDIEEIYEHIMSTDGPSFETFDSNLRNVMPAWGTILSEEDAWDLVKFIKETAHDVSEFYDMDISSGKAVFSNIGKGGSATAGRTVYNAKCSSCHGSDGTKINIYCKGEYLGDMFRNDPHEIQHKAIWGMPYDAEHVAAGCADAGMMPAQDITDQDIRDMMVMGQDTTAFPGGEEEE
jgi:mono/diheme cytochrome c family protein